MPMDDLITAKEAAALAHVSKSKIHRDAGSGELPVAQQFPGYNGPRLFRPAEVLEFYGMPMAAPESRGAQKA